MPHALAVVSDEYWRYLYAEGPETAQNWETHDPRFVQKYMFRFEDTRTGVVVKVSANFDPIVRDWEVPVAHWEVDWHP